MPVVKRPLSSSGIRNGETEGGVIFILGYELPAGWASAVMTEVDFVSDGLGGYHTEFVNSITFGHDITGKIGGYIELFTVTSSAPASSGRASWTSASPTRSRQARSSISAATLASPRPRPISSRSSGSPGGSKRGSNLNS